MNKNEFIELAASVLQRACHFNELEGVTGFRDFREHLDKGKPANCIWYDSNEEFIKACSIEFVPEKLITSELCLEAVKTSAFALKNIPEKFITAELCLSAVNHFAYALDQVPEKFMTAELCLAAVMKNDEAFDYVPYEFLFQTEAAAKIEKRGSSKPKIHSSMEEAPFFFDDKKTKPNFEVLGVQIDKMLEAQTMTNTGQQVADKSGRRE